MLRFVCLPRLLPTTQKLLAIWGPDTNTGTGSQTLGKKFDAADNIGCPKYKVKMGKI